MNELSRERLMRLAVLCEGGLALAAIGLGWLFHIEVLSHLRFSWSGFLAGLVAAVPPFLLLVASEWVKLRPLERIRDLVLEMLGPALAACRWYDLVLLAALAGFGEELLFRGVVQLSFERWALGWTASVPVSWIAGLILSNVIFGLLHGITRTYALLAGLMGIYFGVLVNFGLETPIVAHAVYDYLAFLILVRTVRRRKSNAEGNAESPLNVAGHDKEPRGM
jgi:hypothetical protein